MERFNIENFERRATDDEFSEKAEDGSVIVQTKYAYGYTEKITPKAGLYETYKEFYSSGVLRTRGQLFRKGGFKYGVWPEYSENGALLQQTDFNKPYRLDVPQVMDIVRKQNIPFSNDPAEPFSRIVRNIIKGKATWVVEWKEQPGRVERVFIDDGAAKVTKRDFYAFQDNQ